MTLGKSFTEGAGIKDIRNRFAGILQDTLRDSWTVAVVAGSGWGPKQELEALEAYPRKPDAVILAYHPHDIARIAEQHGMARPVSPLPSKPRRLTPWIDRSSLLNLIYVRWATMTAANSAGGYTAWRDRCFSDETVWAAHMEELLAIVRYCRHRGTPLTLLIIPDLRAIEATRAYTSRVAGLFRDHGVPVVDMTDVYGGMSARA